MADQTLPATDKAEFDRLRGVYRCNNAVATCGADDGILTIDYSGVISQTAFHLLDTQTQHRRIASPVALERMDKAVTIGGDIEVCPCAWGPGTQPSAIIVRDDQYQHSMAFCFLLADRGILRMTFRQCQVDRALLFVRYHQSALR